MSYLWKGLDHDTVLNTVERSLQKPLTNLFLRRNSYINRVFELETAGTKERLIVKFYRPGRWTKAMILEEHAFLKELLDKELPVILPMTVNGKTLFSLKNIPYALFPKMGGRALDEFDKETWQLLGRTIGRMHAIGELRTKASKRLVWRPGSATKGHLAVLLKGKHIPPDHLKAFHTTAELFIKRAAPLFEGQEMLLIHGDCHKGNLIHRPGTGLFLLDFDDICIGPPVQDLWMLLPDKPENCQQELEWFLNSYKLFRDFRPSSLRLIPALRGMRIIHFLAWQAVQASDPDFLQHFPEWETPKYWNEMLKELQDIVYNGLFLSS